jgi:hypothetical protein
MPSHSVTWNAYFFPPGYDHFSHHCYEWRVYFDEAFDSSKYAWSAINFCIP